MPPRVDLYDNAYAGYGSDTYRNVRIETYGQDFGQTSWVATEESNQIPRLLEVTRSSHLLELGCGSGGYALQIVATVGCRLVGVDMNAAGIHNASQLASAKGLTSLAHFEQCDVSKKLPFSQKTFDAVFASDVLCHVQGRPGVLQEIFRVLTPGGRMLFSDALVIGGMVSHEEIATRSSIGFYVYSPPGENERLMKQAGFEEIRVIDTTDSAASIAERWRIARENKEEELVTAEGKENFDGLQRFLSCVHTLMDERRLLRYLYIARRPS